ncbi:hypothetical protein EW145_g4277, partial [Phellinidium pouzarii]
MSSVAELLGPLNTDSDTSDPQTPESNGSIRSLNDTPSVIKTGTLAFATGSQAIEPEKQTHAKMGKTLFNEVESARFDDVPMLLENKLSDDVLSRGLGSAKYPNDEDAAANFSTTAKDILKKLSTTRPIKVGKFNKKKGTWRSWPEKTQDTPVCEYLNTIGDLVRDIYDIPEAQNGSRRFFDMFKSKEPVNSRVNALRKPDGVVLDQEIVDAVHNGSYTGAWSDIHAILQFKESYTIPKRHTDTYKQVLDCAHLIFCSQLNRRFVLGVTLMGHIMTFYVFDRSGALCSEKFNIMKNPEKLVRVVVGLLFSDRIDLGYDITMKIKHTIEEGT